MEQSSITLTVLFDAPFWVGIFERVEGGISSLGVGDAVRVTGIDGAIAVVEPQQGQGIR